MSDLDTIKDAFEKIGIKTSIEDKASKSKTYYTQTKERSPNTTKRYIPSERLALSLGFKEIPYPDAYNGRYFIKNNKIWIHDIDALKARLGVITDRSLQVHGYDVKTYYSVHSYKTRNNTRDNGLTLYTENDISSVGEELVYLSDGVYIKESECWF